MELIIQPKIKIVVMDENKLFCDSDSCFYCDYEYGYCELFDKDLTEIEYLQERCTECINAPVR